MAALISKPGISTTAGGNGVPAAWSQTWFRGFVSDYLKGADVRNAVGNGITISGNITSPYATLTLGGGGTVPTPIVLSVKDDQDAIVVNDIGPIVDGDITLMQEHLGVAIGWVGSGPASFTGANIGDFGIVCVGAGGGTDVLRFGYGGGATSGYDMNWAGPSANFQASQPNIVNFIGSHDTSAGTGLLWLQAGGGSDTYGGTIGLYGGSNTTNVASLGAGGGVWIGTANYGSGPINFGLGGNPSSPDQVWGSWARGGTLSLIPTGSPANGVPLFVAMGGYGGTGTPVAQSSTYPCIQLFGDGVIMADAVNSGAWYALGNIYYNGSNYVAMQTQASTLVVYGSGVFDVYNAPSVSAGSAATIAEQFQIGTAAGAVFWPGLATTASAFQTCVLNSASSPANQMFRSTSSLRYKTNVQTLGTADIDALMQIRPVSYTSTCPSDNPTAPQIGFIAEELDLIDKRMVIYHPTQWQTQWKAGHASLPEVVPVANSPVVPDSIDYSRMTVLLVGAVQALAARLTQLEHKTSSVIAPPTAAPATSITNSGAFGVSPTATPFTGTPVPYTTSPPPPYVPPAGTQVTSQQVSTGS